MDIIKETIAELEERLKSYISTISIPMLEYTPNIVEVGALTVGTDENGIVIVENINFPTQFSKNEIKTIISLLFRNCNDEIVTPKVYGKNEWYSKEIDKIKRTIEELKKLTT